MSRKAYLERIKEKQQIYQSKIDNLAGKMEAARRNVVLDSGIEVKWLYTPADVEDMDYLRDQGFPGEYPFTRGAYPTMHRGRLWTMRAIAGIGSPESQNQRLKYLLEQGETGLNVIFDYPTHMGFDPDSPEAKGEVGRCGTSLCCLSDMEETFDGIDLSKISVSFVVHSPAPVMAAMYYVMAKKRGYDISRLEGSIQNEILKEGQRQQFLVFPIEPSFKLSLDTIEFCTEFLPRWNTTTFNEHAMRDCGLNAVKGIAWALTRAQTYVQGMIDRGWNVDDFVKRFAFFFGIDNNFFEEIAKFRAARRIWARIIKEEFQAKDPRSWMLRFAAQSTGRVFTAQQPMNNIARGTIQCLAAVLGGCQSLNINAMDEALGLPTELAAQTALRSQQIVAYESGVTDTLDPLGGSYYVETLTRQLEEKIVECMKDIDERGGVIACIENGFFARDCWKSAVNYYEQIERGERIVVGVNKHRTEDIPEYKVFRVDKKYEEDCLAKLSELKKNRDNAKIKRVLEELKAAALDNKNIMPEIVQAVEANATLGEIMGTLKEVWGTFTPYRVECGVY